MTRRATFSQADLTRAIRAAEAAGTPTCKHERGDWIAEQGYWLCAICLGKMDDRPKRYGFISPAYIAPGEQRWLGGRQDVVWQAAIATASCGTTLNTFLRAMTRRYMMRTKPTMPRDHAYAAAIDCLREIDDVFGDEVYNWSPDGAREMADEDMDYWDAAEDGGNG